MERAQAGVILRSRFPQLDVLAHHTDDIRLLLQIVGKVSGIGHVLECALWRVSAQSQANAGCGTPVEISNQARRSVEKQDSGNCLFPHFGHELFNQPRGGILIRIVRKTIPELAKIVAHRHQHRFQVSVRP